MGALVVLGIYLVLIAGWVMNIVDIVQTIGGEITALFVARCVGTFVFPLGSLLGLFT